MRVVFLVQKQDIFFTDFNNGTKMYAYHKENWIIPRQVRKGNREERTNCQLNEDGMYKQSKM